MKEAASFLSKTYLLPSCLLCRTYVHPPPLSPTVDELTRSQQQREGAIGPDQNMGLTLLLFFFHCFMVRLLVWGKCSRLAEIHVEGKHAFRVGHNN